MLRLGILGLDVRKKVNLQKKKIDLFPSNYLGELAYSSSPDSRALIFNLVNRYSALLEAPFVEQKEI